MFSLVIDITFLDYLWHFYSLNAAHFESSNAHNFHICEQKHQVWIDSFLVRAWGTLWYQNNSDLTKLFDFVFSAPLEWCYVTSSNLYGVTYLALWRWINFFLSVSPDDYRLIQVFLKLSSFILLWFGLKHGKWLTINLLKSIKEKENLLGFGKYPIYVISWVENIEIFTRVAHSWKFWCFQHIRWNIHLYLVFK